MMEVWRKIHQSYISARSILTFEAVFLDKDFEGLKDVGRGSKRDDPSTIGRFGRGSQTMYHWTDVPMLISGKYFLVLE